MLRLLRKFLNPHEAPPLVPDPVETERSQNATWVAEELEGQVQEAARTMVKTNKKAVAQGERLAAAANRLKQVAKETADSLTSAAAEVERELTQFRKDRP